MEFYRHTFNYNNAIEDQPYISNMLYNFGFVNLEGNPPVIEGGISSDENKFFWKYDTSMGLRFSWYVSTGENPSNTMYYYYGHDNKTATAFTDYGNDRYPDRTFIFIPLKNKNFLMQQYISTDSNKMTPEIAFPNFADNCMPDLSNVNYYAGTSIIGCKDSLGNFGYLRYWFTGDHSFKGALNRAYYYFKNVEYKVSVDSTGFYYYPQAILKFINIKEIQNKRIIKNPRKYYNVNQNICTLTRIPQEDNEFVDGLYACTTYPCDQIEGKVFSFNGRSFLGVYENLVVELPAN